MLCTENIIGIPVDSGPLQGFDALLSTVQKPRGIPVASVAIGKAGAKNAAYLAKQIIAPSDSKLAVKLQQERMDNVIEIKKKDKALQEQLEAH